jgi:NADH:ubiquinone oxidoreductase subunit 2 (subunit N)
VSMFMRDATERTGLTYAPGLTMTLAIATVFTLLIGVYPDPFIALARHAVILGF